MQSPGHPRDPSDHTADGTTEYPLPSPSFRQIPSTLFQNVSALVFDFDGTLTDSAQVWRIVNEKFFSKRGMVYDPSIQDEIAGLNVVQSSIFVKGKYGLPDSPEDILAEWKETYLKLYATDLKYIDGAVEFIRAMRARGLRVGIATAADHQTLDAYFGSHADTRGLFDAIVTTLEVGRAKPDPAVYLECMARLGASPRESVVFEDTVTGLQGAKAAGARIVCIYSQESNLSQKEELSDCVVPDYTPLLQSVSPESAY